MIILQSHPPFFFLTPTQKKKIGTIKNKKSQAHC